MVIGVGAAFEHLRLTKKNVLLSAIIPASLSLITLYISIVLQKDWLPTLVGLSMSISLIGLLGLYFKEVLLIHKRFSVSINFVSFIIPIHLLICMIWLDAEYDFRNIIIPILLIWVNDSFAYLVGRKIGRKKLFPSVSPGKTWEGFLGGLCATSLICILLSFTFSFQTLPMIIMGIGLPILATIGDLVQSSVKRYFGAKDSGNLLPGHGGLWDRYDSFIYICPFIYIFYCFFSLSV